jgi:outer membrane protein assembly factor BamA
VRPGRVARLRRVLVSGNRKSARSHVERLAGLGEGEVLRASALRRAERRLVGSGLFDSMGVLPRWTGAIPAGTAGEGEELADVEVTVREAPHLQAVLSGGYGTFDGARIGLELATRNAFGHGERLGVATELSENGFRALAEARFHLGDPGRLALNLTGIFESREQRSFEADYFGVSPSISWRISPRDELRAGVRRDEVRTTSIAPGVPPGDALDFENTVPFVTILSDRRDSYVNPHRGHILTAQVEGASSDCGSDVSYTRFSTFTSFFTPLGRDVTLALSVHGGVTQPQKDTEVLPVALRYFAGGVGTVRGIPDRELGPKVAGNPTGGEAFVALTAELRFRIWRGLYGAVFADRGEVFPDASDIVLDETRSGVGLGLRYLLPAGFVVADIGFNTDPRPGEPDNIVYFTFGLPF